jgi:hypothetical protein
MSPRRMNSRQQPPIGYWEFLPVATGLVCVTTGCLHIHDPIARFRTDFRILNGDVPSCAPGGTLGHERADAALAKGQRRLPKKG